MRGINIVKICTILGCVLAEIYMVLVVLAPNVGLKETRMIIPREAIPKEEGIAPGTPPPLGAKIERLLIASIFFGPFGACVGLGVGLLLQGALQSFSSAKKPDEE